jgi:putative membrane protein
MLERLPHTGILPWRGPFMLDAIVIGMVFVLIALAWSIYSVKYQDRYQRHKITQLCLSGALLILLILFEVDIQFLENWRALADLSPYYDAATRSGLVVQSLAIHLVFATTTLALWLLIIVRALKQFPNPPGPNRHSRFHARWGMVAAIDMVLTAVTGWVFYFLAFVA